MTILNEYFKKQLDSANCKYLPKEIRDNVVSDFQIMSNLDIDNNEDQNRFFMIRNFVPEISRTVFQTKLNENVAGAVAAEIFRNVKENKDKISINTLLGLIRAIDLALKKMVPGYIQPKLAYPQPSAIRELPQYDIVRWVQATREIYGLMNKGYEPNQAKQMVIGNWEAKEKMDYQQWLKFYTDKTPEKYPKLAADDSFISSLPFGINSLKAHTGKLPNPVESFREPPGLPQPDVNQVRDKIEGQRKKLISRLNSAEKMLASLDGQLFAGDDQELMLKLLQDLKRRIQTANKLTTKSSLFEDQIHRTANLLKAQGKHGPAGFFYKLAQLDPTSLEMPGINPTAAPAQTETPAKGNKDETYKCLKEFFDGLERGVVDANDTPEERKEIKKHEQEPQAQIPSPPPAQTPPVPEVTPTPPATANIDIDTIKLGSGYWSKPRTKTAQEIKPVVTPKTPIQPTEVEIEPVVEEVEDNTDDVIDAALRGISVDDVTKRLEMLVSIYNKREIVRQLSILDLMMDRLGLAAFFPGLGEAMGKALESNQYIGSRLEGVLTKLKGSINIPGATGWVEPKIIEENPDTAGIRNNLKQQQTEESERKELRKKQDLAKLQGGVPTGTDVGPAAIPVVDTKEFQEPVSRIERAPKIDVR